MDDPIAQVLVLQGLALLLGGGVILYSIVRSLRRRSKCPTCHKSVSRILFLTLPVSCCLQHAAGYQNQTYRRMLESPSGLPSQQELEFPRRFPACPSCRHLLEESYLDSLRTTEKATTGGRWGAEESTPQVTLRSSLLPIQVGIWSGPAEHLFASVGQLAASRLSEPTRAQAALPTFSTSVRPVILRSAVARRTPAESPTKSSGSAAK